MQIMLEPELVHILLEKTSNYNNFIISSGCDIPPETPMENIDAFFEIVRKYNSR
ncbi:MAG TPA: hypothetical protein DDW93_11970 [Firmicutes bacterium]|jgi:uroporphyrinogen decarboxylase|nr:hypothetical protein [Bacillota bacterium]HBT16564.1 hypothetical protein [Bacillota bacterium]